MGEPFVGEIRMFGGSFAPAGWAFCSGQSMPISENDVLFTLIGTTYGGDGQETFNLPDLQSRVPMHAGTAKSGTTYQLGEQGGVESVTLNTNQIPIHTHPFVASANLALATTPQGNLVAQPVTINLFFGDVAAAGLNAQSILPVGGSQPHENIQPYLCISFIISLFGVFPQQS